MLVLNKKGMDSSYPMNTFSKFSDWLSLPQNSNPWKDCAFWEKDGKICLREDKDFVHNYSKRKGQGKPTDKCSETSLHLELPPQPWQGNPEARIWILLANPGYDEDDAKFYLNKKNLNAPKAQLAFERSGIHWHYVLNEEHRKWNENCGSYSCRWFRDHFVNPIQKFFHKKEADEAVFNYLDDNIFLLQSHGYASGRAGDEMLPLHFYSQARFLRKLLKWGVDAGKRFYIVRSETLWRYWLNDEKDVCRELEEENRLIVNKNPRNCWPIKDSQFQKWLPE